MLTLLLALATIETAGVAQPAVESTPEDCAVFAAMGRDQLHWTAEARSPRPASNRVPLKGAGGGVYVLTCPWAAMGLLPPGDARVAPRETFDLFRPDYGWARRTATVRYRAHYHGHHRDPWRVTSTTDFSCRLKKGRAGWSVVGCVEAGDERPVRSSG